jgi:hypothetical protein
VVNGELITGEAATAVLARILIPPEEVPPGEHDLRPRCVIAGDQQDNLGDSDLEGNRADMGLASGNVQISPGPEVETLVSLGQDRTGDVFEEQAEGFPYGADAYRCPVSVQNERWLT